ncbi:MAG: DUF7289 family protein [Methanoregula sp.]|jgi:hypothetical protein|nr:MAG: hypothetical protein CVV30_08315 [Methanomicrobiales archaeon HGW-Methanomicrobiales-1]
MTGKNRISCTAGVSESIGFLLIFTIVIAGIGMVTLYGYPMLLQQQTSADEQIMEKNIIVLQNDVKSLAYKAVPYKETSLKIGGGTLAVFGSGYTPATSSIKIYNSTTIYVDSFHSGDLMYSSASAGTDISLQNGAVVKRPHAEPGSVMLAEPRWFHDSQTNTMVINLVNITSTDILSRTGVGTVQMALGETQFRIESLPAGDIVTLEYTPDPTQDYSIAWDNYFQKTQGMTLVSGTPGTGSILTYNLPPTNTLVIKQYEVIIRSL